MRFRPSEQNAPTGATQFFSNKIIIAVGGEWFKGTVGKVKSTEYREAIKVTGGKLQAETEPWQL